MATYKTPGVYVEEVPSLPASVVAVETAVPVFIGITERLGPGSTSLQYIPTQIQSMVDFEYYFGGRFSEPLGYEFHDTADLSGTVIDRKVVITIADSYGFNLYHQVQAYFANGGGRCYVVTVEKYARGVGSTLTAPALTDYVDTAVPLFTNLEKEDEPTLLIFTDPPFDFGTQEIELADYGALIQAGLTHAAKMKDRFVIVDTIHNGTSTWQTDFRTALGNINLSYGAAYYPDLKTTFTYAYTESAVRLKEYYLNGAVAAAPAGFTKGSSGTTLASLTGSDALYRKIKAALDDYKVVLGPCGSIAGVYGRTDRERGVWKAPANTGLSQVLAPIAVVTDADQALLNEDATTGKSINAIRSFTGKGTLVWGARTLDGNSSEWRYVPVRRLLLMIEESIKKATQFVVFEPNDATTWLRTKGMIENFLNSLWRQGALAGARPEQAYQVRVGLNSTMTPEDILEGRMIVEVAVAAVRPAEFIILRFSHKLAEA